MKERLVLKAAFGAPSGILALFETISGVYQTSIRPSLALMAGDLEVRATGHTQEGCLIEGFLQVGYLPDKSGMIWFGLVSDYTGETIHVVTVYIDSDEFVDDAEDAFRFSLVETEWGYRNWFMYAQAMQILKNVSELQLLQIQSNAEVLFRSDADEFKRWYISTPDNYASRQHIEPLGLGCVRFVVPTGRQGKYKERYNTLLHV